MQAGWTISLLVTLLDRHNDDMAPISHLVARLALIFRKARMAPMASLTLMALITLMATMVLMSRMAPMAREVRLSRGPLRCPGQLVPDRCEGRCCCSSVLDLRLCPRAVRPLGLRL